MPHFCDRSYGRTPLADPGGGGSPLPHAISFPAPRHTFIGNNASFHITLQNIV